ncbi:MAG: hypothetical protein E2581_03240 [Pseudomonas sp.]|uniref:hypothetical protein n=1 Tax=Pseudomonas sp. TaxID=306 RepID=UPI001DEFFA4A|nr:hypothetical protein [Pseudomonas sp.]MPS97515.1 hypothetical protein [Pseudomonas sp.]
MTLSIITPDIRFPNRTQLYDLPAIEKNHAFAIFGASRDRSLVNLNASQPNGVVVGEVAFTEEGALVLGNTNAIRFELLRAPGSAGCTILVSLKTRQTIGDAGFASLWSKSQLNSDSMARRLYSVIDTGVTTFNSVPGVTSAASGRVMAASTEYLLSLTRAAKGTPSRLRVHNSDGSVATTHSITEYAGSALPYAADPVFDIGTASSSAQVGAYIKGAALYTGSMSESEISSAAALLYQLTHPA